MTHLGDLFKPDWQFVLPGLGAGLVVAALCAFLGVFVVLKRIVFVGAALAELATVGVALAFSPWLVRNVGFLSRMDAETTRPLFLALLLVLAGVTFFSQQGASRNVPREAIIGTAYAAASAYTIIFLATAPGAEHEAVHLIQGDILTITSDAIRQLLIFAVPIAIVHMLFYKEFVLVSFDPETARTLGFRSSALELLFYLTVGLMIAVAIKVAGSLTVFGYLVLPAVGALQLTRRLSLAFVIAILMALTATICGVYISSWQGSDIPMGPAIIGAATVIVAASALARRLVRG
jgi:ABC-type Mn2+/Zn2+ transport system permease subunit